MQRVAPIRMSSAGVTPDVSCPTFRPVADSVSDGSDLDLLAAGQTLSFEFFPPKTAGGQLTLGRTVAALEPLRPDFVSITYGAGGSDRHRTGDVVEWMRTETDWEPMPHLTCYGHTRDDIAALLDIYREIGIENILALAGDPRVRRRRRGRATTATRWSSSRTSWRPGVSRRPSPPTRRCTPARPTVPPTAATSPTSSASPTSR